MFCRRTQPVSVLHEHTSRLTLPAKLASKNAAETAATLMAIFKRLAPELKGSITFDNGSEFAHHGLLASVSSMTIWFCDTPRSPIWASWRKAASRTPTADVYGSCREISTSTHWVKPISWRSLSLSLSLSSSRRTNTSVT